jgi:outer membrane protein TolC
VGKDTLCPDLEQLHRWARGNSPQVRVAAARLEAAQAHADRAGRWGDPELDGRVLEGEGEPELEAALLFTVPVNGGHSAARRVANVEVALAEMELAAARFDACCELDLVTARLAAARSRTQVHEQMAQRATAYAELARQRQAAGLADPLDVSLILADAARDQRSAERSRDEVRAHESQLNVILGLPQSLVIDAELPGNQRAPVPGLDSLLARAHRSRSAWIRARLNYQRAEWQALRAGRERLPNVAIGPALTRTQDQTRWGVAMGITLPLFANRGADYREALALRDAAYESLAAEGLRASTEIKRLVEHLETIDRQIAVTSGDPLSAAEQALALAQERYAAGRIDVLLLLSAHRAHAELQLEVLDLRLTRQTARLELERALGQPLTASR